MQKNAKDQLQDACSQLQNVQGALNQAMSTVEKPNNKQEIQKTLTAVQNAMSVASSAMSNYQD